MASTGCIHKKTFQLLKGELIPVNRHMGNRLNSNFPDCVKIFA